MNSCGDNSWNAWRRNQSTNRRCTAASDSRRRPRRGEKSPAGTPPAESCSTNTCARPPGCSPIPGGHRSPTASGPGGAGAVVRVAGPDFGEIQADGDGPGESAFGVVAGDGDLTIAGILPDDVTFAGQSGEIAGRGRGVLRRGRSGCGRGGGTRPVPVTVASVPAAGESSCSCRII